MTPDDFNPKFVFLSPTRNHTDLAEHVDHAIIALDGRAPLAGDCFLEPLASVHDHEPLRVDLWVEELTKWSCTYGFTISSEDGRVAFARGERTVVNIDPSSHKPAPWSDAFRTSHAELLKDLPAYA
ncbi:MAG TPA: hypothetical protein VMU84_06185 [Thermoanaerobaculia bacterium]|nr:hypothetical protein [Thermoanaerobaculia bacterium]